MQNYRQIPYRDQDHTSYRWICEAAALPDAFPKTLKTLQLLITFFPFYVLSLLLFKFIRNISSFDIDKVWQKVENLLQAINNTSCIITQDQALLQRLCVLRQHCNNVHAHHMLCLGHSGVGCQMGQQKDHRDDHNDELFIKDEAPLQQAPLDHIAQYDVEQDTMITMTL